MRIRPKNRKHKQNIRRQKLVRPGRRAMQFEPLERRELLAALWTVSTDWANYVLEGADDSLVEFTRECQSNCDSGDESLDDTFTINYSVVKEPFGTSPASPEDYGPPETPPTGLSASDYIAESGTVTLGPGVSTRSLIFHAYVGDGAEGYWFNGSWVPVEYAYVQITSVTSNDTNDSISVDGNDVNLEINDNDPPPSAPQPVLPGCRSCFDESAPGNFGAANGNSSPYIAGMSSGGPPGFSGHPVRYSDGAVYIAASDLSAAGGGIPWGVTRQWTNAPGYSPWNTVGSGMVITEQPSLIQLDGDADQLAVIASGTAAFTFTKSGSAYVPQGFVTYALEYDNSNDEFVLTDNVGTVFRFFGFSSLLYSNQRGQLKGFTDAGGNQVLFAYSTDTGHLSEVQVVTGTGGSQTTESFLYSYNTSGANIGLVASVLLRRKTGTGAWSSSDNIRKVVYDYYDVGEDHGNTRDLKTATIKQMNGTTETAIDTTYYRYYKDDDIYDVSSNQIGYVRGLKYVFGADSYARLAAYTAALPTPITPEQASDGQVEEFADNYFEYDADQRATKEVAQGAGCSTCSGGLGSFSYAYTPSSNADGYNSWHTKTVETLPDGNENIVYTNYMGEVMLQAFHDTTTDQQWVSFYHYDNAGRVDMAVMPSAVPELSGKYYDDQYADLMHDVSGNYEYIADSAGLITTFTFATSTTATTSANGDAAGYLKSVAVKNGESGSVLPQSGMSYRKRTINAGTTDEQSLFLVASSTVYPTAGSTSGGLSTSNAYTFFSGKLQVESVATTDPAGGVTTVLYDSFGRPIWTKDPAGFISRVIYDQQTGGILSTIVDVDTGSVSDEPSGWSTPTTPVAGGAHLTTEYVLDALGRPTTTTVVTTPQNQVTLTVYKDDSHEIRVYPGWNSTTHTTTGPTIVLRADRATAHDSYLEVLTMSATPQLSSSNLPTGGESIGSVKSLSRTYYNDAGQAVQIDEYFDFDPAGTTYDISYNVAAHHGTINQNFNQISLGYDNRGRQNRMVHGDGTIVRTVYDGLGRPVSEWLGSDDTPAGSYWTPTDNGDMVLQAVYAYDEGEVGDSQLTSVADGLGRTTSFGYDFRGRQTSATLPEPSPWEAAPVYTTGYDNLGRIVSSVDPLANETTYFHDDVNRTLTITQPSITAGAPVTVQAYDARGLLISLTDPDYNTTTWEYDGAGRIVSETNALSLTLTYEYDGASQLTDRIDRNGRKIHCDYDLAGRNTAEKWYDTDLTTLVRTLSFGYDAAGRLSMASDSLGTFTYTYLYDALGRLLHDQQAIEGLTPDIQYARQYNGAGQLTQLDATIGTTADFRNTYAYDDLARLQNVIQQPVSGGNTLAAKRANFTYTAANQVESISRYADTSATELVINSFYKYDDMGRLAKLVHTMATTAPTSGWGSSAKAGYEYSYDAASRITYLGSRNDGAGTYDYDATGQLTYTFGGGAPETTYAYDLNGNRSSHTIGANNQLLVDNLGNTYTYDNEGNRLSKTDANYHTTNYEYDWRNRLVRASGWLSGPYPEEDGEGTDWGIYPTSDNGSITVGPTVGEGTSWGWGDTSGTVTSGAYAVNVSVASATEGNTIVVTLTPTTSATFDVNYVVGQVSAMAHNGWDYSVTGGYTGTITMSGGVTQYLYITTVDDSDHENTESLGISLDINGDPYSAAGFEGDIYDNDATSNENVPFAVQGATVVEGTSGAVYVTGQPGLTVGWSIEDASADGGDYYASGGTSGTTMFSHTGQFVLSFDTYDSRDFELRQSFRVRVWDANDEENEVIVEVRIVDKDTPLLEFATVEYVYDHQNQMVARIFDADGAGGVDPTSTFYSYQDGQVALEFSGTNATDLAHRYFWNPTAIDQLFADEQVADDIVLWALADHQGTVRDLATHNAATDATTVVLHRTYDAFGNIVGASGSLLDGYAGEGDIRLSIAANDALFGYTGRQFDPATWLQYNLNRWYDAKTGRWISEDPIGFSGDNSSLIRYVGNSPLLYSDPTGHAGKEVDLGHKGLYAFVEWLPCQNTGEISIFNRAGKELAKIKFIVDRATGGLEAQVVARHRNKILEGVGQSALKKIMGKLTVEIDKNVARIGGNWTLSRLCKAGEANGRLGLGKAAPGGGWFRIGLGFIGWWLAMENTCRAEELCSIQRMEISLDDIGLTEEELGELSRGIGW